MFVPSENKNLYPVEVKLTPVPDTVLKVTVCEPVVAFSTMYNFSTESGTVTVDVPVNAPS
jgi:hypothetical protein